MNSPGKNTGEGCNFLLQCYMRAPQWLTGMFEYWWFHYTSDIFHSTKNCSLLWEAHTLTHSTHTLLSNPHILPKHTFTFRPLLSHPYTYSLAYHHISTHISSTHILLSHTPLKDIKCVFSSYYASEVCVCVCACTVAQSCPTLCHPMDCSLPGSSVHGIF